jgi:hypothetical protein
MDKNCRCSRWQNKLKRAARTRWYERHAKKVVPEQ